MIMFNSISRSHHYDLSAAAGVGLAAGRAAAAAASNKDVLMLCSDAEPGARPSVHPAMRLALLKLLLLLHYHHPTAGEAHGFHETCQSFTSYFMNIDSKRCCDTTTTESIHTKDESKRRSAFAFIFGVN